MLLADHFQEGVWPPLASENLVAHRDFSDWESGGNQYQPNFGARICYYRCFLPDLAGFTTYRRETTDTSYHNLIMLVWNNQHVNWRRERDSNPRYAINVHTLSRRAP